MNQDQFLKGLTEDKDINDSSIVLNYLNILAENLRRNYSKLNRNSFLLIISAVGYILILTENESIGRISILFLEFRDIKILINLIPVFFSYLLLNNIAIWINCTSLNDKLKELSKKAFQFGILSESVNLIRPFSILHDLIDYQYNNKRVPWIYKVPLTIGFIILFFAPIAFVGFTLFIIIRDNYLNIMSVSCFSLTLIFFVSSLVRVIISSKS